jgi:uncharacterized protein YcbK (DUF882 family)
MFRRLAFLAVLILCSLAVTSVDVSANVSGARGLNPRLVNLLNRVSRHFRRPVVVVSGCRSRKHNRRVGGARNSMHLRCMAADIRVSGVARNRVARFARGLPGRGGIGTYCRNSVVHIDVGPRREWNHGCGRKKSKRRFKRQRSRRG